METWIAGIVIKPFVALAFFLFAVIPVVLIADRLIPAGRMKRMLWLDMTTPAAPRARRIVATLIVLSFYVALIGCAAWLNSSS